MSANPFGPMSPTEFQEAVDAPFGGAVAILRKYDPMWGKFPSGEGEKIRWKVRLHQQVTMMAIAYVEAESQAEAEALADLIDAGSLTFDSFIDADNGEVVDVVAA